TGTTTLTLMGISTSPNEPCQPIPGSAVPTRVALPPSGARAEGSALIVMSRTQTCLCRGQWRQARGVTKRPTLLVIGDGFIGDGPADFATAQAADRLVVPDVSALH